MRRIDALRGPPATTVTLIVVGLLLAHAIAQAQSTRERFERGSAAAGLTLYNGADFATGTSGRGLALPSGAYAEWRPSYMPTTRGGTIILWVSPLWLKGDAQSHSFLTFTWSGEDRSYFALSQGWWEPKGGRKLFAVLSNQDGLACYTPGTFDYTLYLPNEWTMLVVTWQSGNPGFMRLYVDGKRLCQATAKLEPNRTARGPLYLGSDLGASDQRGRTATAIIDDTVVSSRVWSDEEVWDAYARAVRNAREKWLVALLNNTNPTAPAIENRVMTDEDPHWLRGQSEVRRTIDRVKAAGFNVYVPCVWNGGEALFRTNLAPMAPGVDRSDSEAADTFRYLLEYAHSKGVQVHPWFIVTRRVSPGLSAQFAEGAPEGAYNIHNPAFGTHIAALISSFAARYEIDGINLDYIRSLGPCSSAECLAEYSRRYGRSLMDDWQAHLTEQKVPSLIEWNREAMTDIIRKISTAVRAAKPQALLSIDSVPYDHGRWHQGVDESAWIGGGLIDMLFIMAYEHPLDIDRIDRAVGEFGGNRITVLARNYDHVGSQYIDRSGVVVADFVRLKRTRWPVSGIGYYHYPHTTDDQVTNLSTNVFGSTAAAGRPAAR